MDWTKAKSILIIALIVTNIVLIFTYVFKADAFVSTDETILSDTIDLLNSKNIFIETTIPKKHNRMPVLTVEYDTIDQDILEEQLLNQKPLSSLDQTDTNIERMASEFIDRCNLLTENVRLDSIENKDNNFVITYKNYINEIPIEDSYIICEISDGIVQNVKRYWLNPIEFGKTKKEVIPAVAALIKFMSENDHDEKIYVEEISLVYWLDSSAFNTDSPVSDTAFPAWKITYNHGKIMYIMAYEQ